MAKNERNILDDLIEGARRLIKELDEMLYPEKKQQKQRVPVRIPVRPNRHPQDRRRNH